MKNQIENKISYWSKHQELDKFNYNLAFSRHISSLSLMAVLFFGVLTYALATRDLKILYTISFIVFIVVLFSSGFYIKNTIQTRRSFKVREAMLRVWYNQLGVETDKLDDYYSKIISYLKRKNTNKEIEELAKLVLGQDERQK